MIIQISDRRIDKNFPGSLLKSLKFEKVDKVILREKDMDQQEYLLLAKEFQMYKDKLIVHSRVDVAKEIKSWALHLTFNDYINNRKSYKRIGVSVHSLEELKTIEKNADTDYVLISHIFETESKKEIVPKGIDFIENARKNYSGKLIALGGISEHNMLSVLKSGADGIAGIRMFLKNT